MKDKLLRLLNHSIVYGVSQMATKVISFLLLPAYTYWMNPQEYGAVTLYYSFIASAMILYSLGTDVSLLKYYTPEKLPERRKSLFSTVFILAAINSTFLTVIFWIFRTPLSSLVLESNSSSAILTLCFAVIWFDTMLSLPFIILRAENKSLQYGIFRVASAVINLVMNIWLVGFLKMGLKGVLVANIISSSCILIVLLLFLSTKINWKIDKTVISKIYQFGLPNVPILFSVYAFELGARKLLEVYASIEVTGYYGVGAKLGMSFSILAMSFRSAWQPFFLEEGENKDSPELFARVLTYFLLIFTFLFLLITFFIPALMMWNIPILGKPMIEKSYWIGLQILPVILLGQLFNGITANLSTGLFLKSRLHIQAVICIISAMIAIVFNLFFLPKWGMWAAAWSIVIGYGSIAIGEWYYSQKYYPVPFEWFRITKLFVITGVLWYVGMQWTENLFIRFFIILSFPIILWNTGFFFLGERYQIKNKINSLRHKSK